MSLGLLYWILMLIWLVATLGYAWPDAANRGSRVGGGLLLWVLLLIIGWQMFGAPLQPGK